MKILENVSLKDKNWFGTGGDAKYYAEPQSVEEFAEALGYAKQNSLEIFVLGSGANILINDAGFDGLVIKPEIRSIEVVSETHVKAGTGVVMDDLIEFCLDNGFVGLDELSGIPGTVGGSVYINIHYYKFLLSDFLVSGTVIKKDTGEILEVRKEWFELGYDTSKLFGGEYYLLDATFRLDAVDSDKVAYTRGRREEIIRHRQSRFPYKGTCGSFFRNFREDEVSMEIDGRKVIWSAYYLDKIGVKGVLQVGQARVSHQHANMLVNLGEATSTDIINLAKEMQQLVLDKYGILLQPECQLIGFEKYPLLK